MSADVRMRRAGGFSLIELMVSIVIGLLAILFATKIMTDNERNKDGALGGSDSMQNGMMAMFTISADAEQAGFGLNDPILAGCPTIFSDNDGYEMETVEVGGVDIKPLASALIVDGGSGPDRISFYSNGAVGGAGSLRLNEDYKGGSTMVVDRNPYGFTKGDVFMVAPEDGEGECALAQVSSVSTENKPTIAFNDTADRYNTGALGRNFDRAASRVFNLGPAAGLSLHTWQVKDNVLRVAATNMGGGGAPQAVADNIVSIKGQYGIGDAGSLDVKEWTNDIGSAQKDYQSIVAVRLAVVARNRTPQRPGADGKCSATTDPVTVFGIEQPAGITAVPVTLDLEDADAPIDWTCYQYRAFETIVPLRNAAWRPKE